MSVVSVDKDYDAHRLVVVADFAAPIERVWQLWADPRKLERWWGPPSYPVTFTRYEFEPGGQCRYCMTGPEDFKHYGWWGIESIDEPQRLEFKVGPSGDDGEPVPGAEPMSGVVTFERIGSGTRMTVLTQFTDTEQMEQMIRGGMEQGMRQQIGQLDALLEPVRAA